MSKLKEMLKKILPMPYQTVKKYLENIKNTQKKQQQWNVEVEKNILDLQEQVKSIANLLNTIKKNQDEFYQHMGLLPDTIAEIENKVKNIEASAKELKLGVGATEEKANKIDSGITELQRIGKNNSDNAKDYFEKIFANTNEIIWASVFNNAIYGENWLKDKAFYPGRWAIGYPVLYVLYRILNEVKPKNILELGLGQSTRMITQYAAAYKDVKHYVVEHDEEWIRFFEWDVPVSENTEIVRLDREMKAFLDAEEVRQFHGFEERFKNEGFDLIFIDAPLGGDMKQYSRVDVLSIIPQCLKKSFVILMDDYNRIGEKHTGNVIEKTLQENGINIAKGIYKGQKEVAIWVSEDNAFLKTM